MLHLNPYCSRCNTPLPANYRKSMCHDCVRAVAFRKDYGGLREKVMKRDKYQCRNCGCTRTDHKQRYGLDLSVDHIDSFGSNVSSDWKHNTPANLITLCSSCHMGKHALIRRHQKNSKPQSVRKIERWLRAQVFLSELRE